MNPNVSHSASYGSHKLGSPHVSSSLWPTWMPEIQLWKIIVPLSGIRFYKICLIEQQTIWKTYWGLTNSGCGSQKSEISFRLREGMKTREKRWKWGMRLAFPPEKGAGGPHYFFTKFFPPTKHVLGRLRNDSRSIVNRPHNLVISHGTWVGLNLQFVSERERELKLVIIDSLKPNPYVSHLFIDNDYSLVFHDFEWTTIAMARHKS